MKRIDDSQRNYEMYIKNRARKLLNQVDTGHLTYGESHVAAVVISTQNDHGPDPCLVDT
ncbi:MULTISPECIES: hypothetical protein [Corynebacterium]|jgi:adenylate kinase|uniref:hypothetical protein n=2 Tax=Corynebacteriaceae TaxID=1653 RepID=UPI00254AE894|nr:hypothetical protein [Corynebacterium sp. MSK192]MDK8699181.1 hypothetical protein [Corynebacterium sp. MSK192]